MKKRILILAVALCFSCQPNIETPNDLLEANLAKTSKSKSWSDLKTFTSNFEVVRMIGDSVIGSQKKVVFNKVPVFQKEEGYKDGGIEYLNVSNEDGGLMVKFGDGNLLGSTKIPGKSIAPNPVLLLKAKSENLILVDSLWEEKPVYYLKDNEADEAYVFDKDRFLLLAKYEPSYYGKAIRKYEDYRWVDGYYLPFNEDYLIGKGGFRMRANYSSYDINPDYEPTLFQIKPEWLTLDKGDKVPEFELPLIKDTSKIISNNDITNKVVLIDFWATWCKPCIAEFPFMREAYKEFNKKGFEIISVSLDTDEAMLTRFLEKNSFPWSSTHPDGGFKSEMAKRFQVVSLPKPILVDKDGTILATDSEARGDNLEKLLESTLN